jgi:hypothetical protein
LQRELDSQEFAELLAYDRYIEPIGGHWRQAATIAATVAAGYTTKGKRPQVEDFIPTLKIRPGREKGRQMEAAFKAFAKQHNERLKNK